MESASTQLARLLVKDLYLLIADSGQIEDEFEYLQWKSQFEEIHGELERKRNVDRDKVAKLFEIPKDFDLSRFVLSVEICLAIRMRVLTAIAIKRTTHERSIDEPDVEIVRAAIGKEVSHPAESLSIQGYGWTDLFSEIANSAMEKFPDSLVANAVEIAIGLDSGPLQCVDWYQAYYSSLVPKEVRHALGSYYTPEWLVAHVIETALSIEATDVPPQQLRVLDPTSGSGVFLVGWMRHLIAAINSGTCSPGEALDALFHKIVGIDISPLAVLAAQSNLIVAMCMIMKMGAVIPDGPLELPIVCADALDQGAEVSLMAEGALFNTASLKQEGIAQKSHLLGEQFDLIIGNPPWVNWEYMPPNFREKHESLWPSLGLFSLKGRDKSFSKEDVSALFFHYSIASFMTDAGICAMVLPQSLLKSSLNGRGFRRLWIADRNCHIRVRHVDDMTDVRPFEGVANRTAIVYASLGSETRFPVTYDLWSRSAERLRSKERQFAEPSSQGDIGTPWISGPKEILAISRSIEGQSSYRARTGLFTGGANAVYHVEITQRHSDGSVTVRNITERAKRAAPEVEERIEATYLYPFLRGREVKQWGHEISAHVLLPHTKETRMAPVPVDEMRQKAPLTLDYFERFQDILSERRGFTAWERQHLDRGFYAVQRVGDYTFSKNKVVWRYISSSFTCAVIGCSDQKPVIPNEKLMLISCDDEDEAFYLCGVLSSSIVRASVEAKMVSTQIAPYLIERIGLPKWDAANSIHRLISASCREGHESLASRVAVEGAVDRLGAQVFNLDEKYALAARSYLSSKRS